MSDIFREVSVKGRVAYGIVCLEKSLCFYKCPIDKWKWLLEKLWEFTNVEFLDTWFYEVAEYLPDVILDCEYDSSEYEYLSEKQFYELQDTYKTSNSVLNQIIEIIFEIVSVDLYAKLIDHSPNTLNSLNKLKNILLENNIELPDASQFIPFSFKANNGWGESFKGIQYSLVLNNE